MKQVLQQARTGQVAVAEVPVPRPGPACVLVRVVASLVSAGTERAVREFATKNLLRKAQARPDLVREVIGKVRRDGISSAMATVRSRLDQPTTLGYSSAGTVVGLGEGVAGIAVGDRVACAGVSHAVHAEFAAVPRLLAARIPPESSVTFEEAAFTALGAVALHGLRTADIKIGEVVAVIGLGLVGQLTVQLLKAAGCRVLGMDIAQDRADLALRMGANGVCVSAENLRDLCAQHSGGYGADAVLICAETASSDPVNLAAEVARDRGVIVAVGSIGLEIERRLYYEKELDFRISRSCGPGRYDPAYEHHGRDYPIGYVRWTETRNMEAVLDLLSEGKLRLRPLITHRFPIESASAAYELIGGENPERSLGVIITYSEQAPRDHELQLVEKESAARARDVRVGILGAGDFAMGTLLPAIRNDRSSQLMGICAATGARARHAGDKFGFRYCTTDERRIIHDPGISTVVIATRHHLHAAQVCAALAAGKHVFCEKPLCLSETQLEEIVHAYKGGTCALMVGFNRRFAPMSTRMKKFLRDCRGPLVMHYRVNAGRLAPDHWANDPDQGGGRLLGEVCHFVDFLTFLAGALPVEVQTRSKRNCFDEDVVVSLEFANGSMGTISYLVNGDRALSKERVEVFGGGAVAVLEDFRFLQLVQHGRKQTIRSRWRQDKGHRGEWKAFANFIRSGSASPIPFEEIVAATLATLRAAESQRTGLPMALNLEEFFTNSRAQAI